MRQLLKPLHLACKHDDEHPNFSLIAIRKNTATASNGNLLVKLDLTKTSSLSAEDLETLEGKFIHMNTWKEIFKADELEFEPKAIHCHKNGIKKTFYYDTVAVQKEFFQDDIVQEVMDLGQERKGVICHSAAQIENVHHIFQEDNLNMSFSAKNRGTVIWADGDKGMFAILKPEEQVELNRYLFKD